MKLTNNRLAFNVRRLLRALRTLAMTSLIGLAIVPALPLLAQDNTERKEIKYEESPLNFGLDLQYGRPTFSNYALGSGSLITAPSDQLNIKLEWLPIKSFGYLGVGIGGGFSRQLNAVVSASSFASVYTVPIEGFVSYHADIFPHMPLVPYVRLGAEITMIQQTSATGGAVPGIQTYCGLDYSAGLALSLNWIDPSAARDMDRTIGVNNTELIAEYFSSMNCKGTAAPDLSGGQWRFGMRFEF